MSAVAANSASVGTGVARASVLVVAAAAVLGFFKQMMPRTAASRKHLRHKHSHARNNGSWLPFLVQATNCFYLFASLTAFWRGLQPGATTYLLGFLSSCMYHHWPDVDALHRLDWVAAVLNMVWHFFLVGTAPVWTPLMYFAAVVCFARHVRFACCPRSSSLCAPCL